VLCLILVKVTHGVRHAFFVFNQTRERERGAEKGKTKTTRVISLFKMSSRLVKSNKSF